MNQNPFFSNLIRLVLDIKSFRTHDRTPNSRPLLKKRDAFHLCLQARESSNTRDSFDVFDKQGNYETKEESEEDCSKDDTKLITV